MEQNVAILIADLSGYTALTETHGPITAADTIDRYLEIVSRCLVGNSVLHQSVGDEVLIVSSSADEIICTAVMMLQNCSAEHNFLQLHGGLHYGKVLKRNNNYFGSALNLTSRMAAKANKGTFWCSDKFINAIADKSGFEFNAQGYHNFKNVSAAIEMFELILKDKGSYFIDPVCRMLLHKKETAVPHPDENIFFCSAGCRDIYLKGTDRK